MQLPTFQSLRKKCIVLKNTIIHICVIFKAYFSHTSGPVYVCTTETRGEFAKYKIKNLAQIHEQGLVVEFSLMVTPKICAPASA